MLRGVSLFAREGFSIRSSFVVVNGEPGLLERWFPTMRVMVGSRDQLIVVDCLESDFQLDTMLPCEAVLIKVDKQTLRGDWARMLNLGYRRVERDLVYQFDSDKHIVDAVRFRRSTEIMHSADCRLLVIGRICDHPTKGEDYSEMRKQLLDYSMCWGGNVSFLRSNLLFYNEKLLAVADREWAFRMVHESGCQVVWNEEAVVRHISHRLQSDHGGQEIREALMQVEELNEETLARLSSDEGNDARVEVR